MSSPVVDLKTHHDLLMAHLLEMEPSLAVASGVLLSKSLLLAGASELETQVQQAIIDYFEEMTGGPTDASRFVQKKALSRQYHTLFDWTGTNANSFFGLFGKDFRDYASGRVKANSDLDAWTRAFLRLGNERNQLVHENFAAYPLTMTVGEIFALYEGAVKFGEALPALLRRSWVSAATTVAG